jgi:hypothetical protein
MDEFIPEGSTPLTTVTVVHYYRMYETNNELGYLGVWPD